MACVDDSRTVQFFVKKTLESSGYRVLSILDPTKQFSDLFKQKPLLILMDIDMPDINGHQFCKILQRSRATKNIPIIMLTGKKGVVSRVQAQFNQVKDYLT
ncbi:MAG: response regulator, partial [Prochloraceae cyanobacterium]